MRLKSDIFVAIVTAVLLSGLMVQPVSADEVAPQIYASAVSAPAGVTLLDRSPLYYVAGNKLDVVLTVPAGSTVTAVKVRGEVMQKAESIGVDPPDIYYSIVSDQSLTPAHRYDIRHRITLRLHFRNDGRGNSDPIEVLVSNSSPIIRNAPVAKFNFTLIAVKSVGGNVAMSFSEAELRNEFLLDLWQKFGDDGKFPTEGKVLYGPSYDEFLIQIKNDGFHFLWKFKVVRDNWCDPTVTVKGRFALERRNDAIAVVWREGTVKTNADGSSVVVGPRADLDFPLRCDITTSVVPFFGIVSGMATDSIQRKIAGNVQTQVDALVTAFSGEDLPVDPIGLISSIQTLPGELRVNLALPFDSVTIEVPYNGLRNLIPVDRGVPLKPGDNVYIFANGRVRVCASDNPVPAPGCNYNGWNGGTTSGPSGLFNTATNLPIGNPSLPNHGLNGEGSKVFNALAKVTRNATVLPLPKANVGGLIVRHSAKSPGNGFSMSEIVPIRAVGSVKTGRKSQGDWLTFGMNERAEVVLPSIYGGGVFRVAILWSQSGMGKKFRR